MTSKTFFSAVTVVLLPLILVFDQVSAQSIEFKELDGTLQLWDQGRHILSYQSATKSLEGTYPRANYVHPLNDFQGRPLTEDFPQDHLHQRGIFWAWHQLYIDGASAADPWECRDIEWWVKEVDYNAEEDRGIIEAEIYWRVGKGQQQVMRERLTITYQNFPDHYTVDFNIKLVALTELELGGSQDEKGYGGFSTRLQLGNEVRFYGSSGEITPKNTQVQAGDWIKITGLGEHDAQVVIMYHQNSTADLQGWILRKSGSMQNPVWPGSERVLIGQDQEFGIRTRVMVFKNQDPSLDQINVWNGLFQESDSK